jgi:hypothetical protein
MVITFYLRTQAMPDLPTCRLRNRSRKDHVRLQVFGWIMSFEEAVNWLLRKGEPAGPRDGTFAIETIVEALQLKKNELHYPWTIVTNPVDKELTNCFYVGSNRSPGSLNRAKDWERIRRFQRVLEIDEDVLPRWYKVST